LSEPGFSGLKDLKDFANKTILLIVVQTKDCHAEAPRNAEK